MDWVELRRKAADVVKKYKYALLVLLLGLALMLIPGANKESETQSPQQPTQAAEEKDITQQLAQILSQIQGAGKVEVMLTIAAGEKTIYQTDEDITEGENGSTRIETVIITDGERAQSGLIQQVDPPSYLGAIIVCQGADKPSVRLAIVEAVSKVTGLGADKISVLKMK